MKEWTEEELEGKQRLAKVMAARGIASRRAAEQMIAEGKVTVNDQVVHHPGHPVDPDKDRIKVEGKVLKRAPRLVYYVLNKPKGYITGRDDPKGRPSVLELLGTLPERVEPVGRLDFNTEGVLLLTNDGPLAHKLTHPSTGIPKRYMAKIYRTPSESTLARIERGVMLEDGPTGPCKVRVMESTDAGNCWVEITVTEGRNRLVRRLFASLGHPVAKLRRESFATIALRDLEVGMMRPLTSEEITRLHELVEGVNPGEAGKKAQRSKVGFAKPDPAWIEKRTKKQHRGPKPARKFPAKGGRGTVNTPARGKPPEADAAAGRAPAGPGRRPAAERPGPEQGGGRDFRGSERGGDAPRGPSRGGDTPAPRGPGRGAGGRGGGRGGRS